MEVERNQRYEKLAKDKCEFVYATFNIGKRRKKLFGAQSYQHSFEIKLSKS